MEKKSISFTKLGTVKSDDFEYTCEDFYQLIHSSIIRNVNYNSVSYNASTDCYEIEFKGIIYKVFCGKDKLTRQSSRKDIIKALEELVSTTNEKKELKKTENERKKEELEVRNIAIENGDKGIFNSDDDKRIYIEYLKEELKKIPTIGKSIVYIASGLISLLLLFAAFFTPLMLGIELFEGLSDIIKGLSIVPTLGISTFVTIVLIKKFADFHEFLSDLGIDDVSSLDEIIEKRKIKKRIKALKNSLSKSKSKEIVSKRKEESIVEVKDTSTTKSLNPVKHSVKEISKEIRELKEIILKINNDEQKKEFSSELLEILDYYKEVAKTFEEKGDYLSVHRQLLNQIYSLRFRAEELIREEKKRKKTDDEFRIMIEEIDSIGKNSKGAK